MAVFLSVADLPIGCLFQYVSKARIEI